jgi:gas vesicle protein GvpK
MKPIEELRSESEAVSDFARIMQTVAMPEKTAPRPGLGARINLDPDQVKNGLGQLVLTLVKLLHELLERQALRRIEAGTLAPDEIERLGVTLMRQAEEIKRLQQEFGLNDEDLNIDLGPLGTLL